MKTETRYAVIPADGFFTIEDIRTAKASTINRRLDELQMGDQAAFTDGQHLVILFQDGFTARKYEIVWGADYTTLTLKPFQDLSVKGFERCLKSYCDSDGKWWDCVRFNHPADKIREDLRETYLRLKQIEDQRAEESRKHWEKEAQRKLEHNAQIDALVAGAKWKKGSFDLACAGSKLNEKVQTKGLIYRGIGAHVEQGFRGKSYKLTHIASGLSFGLSFDTLRDAKIAGTRIAHSVAVDFSQIKASEVAKIPAVMALVVALRQGDAYAIC